MLKICSKGYQYTLRALAHVVAEQSEARFQVRDICQRAGIPEPFTRKVFQALVQGGFLRTHRGPGGGYSLTRQPSEITLLEVLEAVEGTDETDHCLLGFEDCVEKGPCPLHALWRETQDDLISNLSKARVEALADLSHCMANRGRRRARHARSG